MKQPRRSSISGARGSILGITLLAGSTSPTSYQGNAFASSPLHEVNFRQSAYGASWTASACRLWLRLRTKPRANCQVDSCSSPPVNLRSHGRPAFIMIARPYNHQSLPATDVKILLLSGGFVNDLVFTFRMAYLNEWLFDVCSGANKSLSSEWKPPVSLRKTVFMRAPCANGIGHPRFHA